MSHDTAYYTLGRGVLAVAEFSGSTPGAYLDVGNCPRLELTVKEEQLEHFSSRSGLRTKDSVVTLEVGYGGTFELDEISRDNLAMFLKGTIEGSTIHGLKGAEKKYALRFTSDNAQGPNYIYDFWKVKLTPGGAYALVGEKEWSKLTYNFEGEADTTGHPASEFFDVTLSTTTTTTTV